MKTTLQIIAFLLATAACSAQWQLIDDFQQWEDGDFFTDATDIGWHGISLDGTDEYWFLEDPYDPANITMFVESGNYGIGYGTVWIQKALPGGGIAPGETGTLFLRSFWRGFYNNWHVGTTDRQLEYDSETGKQTVPGSWGDFNALIRTDRDLNIEHRDGDGYVSTDPRQVVNVNQWYSFWIVVENTWDMSITPPTSTGVYTLYMQGPGIGDGESPTLIPVGTDPPKDKASFRRAPVDDDGNPHAIIWVQFSTDSAASIACPSCGDLFLLDDFYFSQGENLSSPLDWADYTIEPSGDVDTGDWLGWINVSQAPYILSYSNGWFWMDESTITESGAWAYFFK